MQKYKHLYVRVYLYIQTSIYIYIRLLLPSSWLLLLHRLTLVPPIPMPRGQDFSFEGARTIQAYVYTYTSIRRSSPGKLCVGSVLAMCVLDHPWETMSWITPGKLCVASAFGNCVLSALVLSFWVPSFGSRLWPDMAHGSWPIGPGCVASRLAYYVLHQCLEIMCFASPLGDDGGV